MDKKKKFKYRRIALNQRKRLGKKQEETLEYIKRFTAFFGEVPSEQEIADEFGVTRSAIQQRLLLLIDKGYIRKRKGKRNILLL